MRKKVQGKRQGWIRRSWMMSLGVAAAASVPFLWADTGSGGLDITFVQADVSSYAGNQDSGTGTVLNGGVTLEIEGNVWKKIPINYTVTPNTVLEFDIEVDGLGEIIGIGLDEDETFNNGKRVFQLDGFQTWEGSLQVLNFGFTMSRYCIPIGQFYTGQMNHLVFVGDDDAAAFTLARFHNVRLRERTIEISKQVEFIPGSFLPYGSQDSGSSTAEVINVGNGLTISGNAWKRVLFSADVMSTTYLDFEMESTDLGEITGIGFDENESEGSPKRIFQVGGSQSWNNAILGASYTGPGFERIVIPVGMQYTGVMNNLVFVSDDDVDGSGDLTVRNVHIHQGVKAEDDGYDVDPTGVSIPAPGILTNDEDVVNGVSLTATLVDQPANGTLSLLSDGSFTYTPDPGFSGLDRFSYRSTDGTVNSRETDVYLSVESEDSDGDGLPDWWEMAMFGTLAYGPNDDPDGDGLTNAQEFARGLNPNNADTDGDGIPDNLDSTPGLAAGVDTDGDFLPDTWEYEHFGDLAENGFGDPDLDQVNNMTEFLQGRTPTAGAVDDTNNDINLTVSVN